jgi:hypothetical protein
MFKLKKKRLKKKKPLNKTRKISLGVKQYLILLKKRYVLFKGFFSKIRKVFEGLEGSGFKNFFKFGYFFFLKFFRRLKVMKNLRRFALLKTFRKVFLLIRFFL